jgi:hypothetical protein
VVLAVFLTQELNSSVMLLSVLNYDRGTVNNHVAQIMPIFLVQVNDQADVGVHGNVHGPPELRRLSSFGFFVNWTVDRCSVVNVTDWNDVWFSAGCRGSQVR